MACFLITFDTCAVSGTPIKPLSLKYNRGLRKRTGLFLLMGGGIMTINDAKEFMDIGADSISICTMVARNIKEATRLIEIKNG